LAAAVLAAAVLAGLLPPGVLIGASAPALAFVVAA